MPSFRPTRRQLLAGLGAGGVAGLGAATNGAVTVEGVSPAWRAWRTRLERPERELAGTDERVFAVRQDELVVASREGGEVEARTELTAEDSRFAVSGATVGHGQVYAGMEALEAFRHDGTRRWSITPEGYEEPDLEATAVTTDRTVIGAFRGGTLVGATPDGGRVWRTDLPVEHLALDSDGTGVYAVGGPQKLLFGIDGATGGVCWEHEVDLSPNAYGPLAAGAGAVTVTGEGLVTVGADTGNERWRVTDDRINAATISEGQVVAVGGETGEYEPGGSGFDRPTSGIARGFDADTGERAWESSLEGEPLLPPVPDDGGYLVVDEGSHGLQAVGPEGQHRWWLSLNVPPKNGIGALTQPVPGDPHVVGADDHLVGVAERPF